MEANSRLQLEVNLQFAARLWAGNAPGLGSAPTRFQRVARLQWGKQQGGKKTKDKTLGKSPARGPRSCFNNQASHHARLVATHNQQLSGVSNPTGPRSARRLTRALVVVAAAAALCARKRTDGPTDRSPSLTVITLQFAETS